MSNLLKMLSYGLILWIVPFLASFPFVDSHGNYTVPETLFKSIMVVVGTAAGVVLSVAYFGSVKKDFFGVGVIIGLVWLAVSLAADLVLVYTGFFRMSFTQYFTDIGLRYLSIPIYTAGMGYVLRQKKAN